MIKLIKDSRSVCEFGGKSSLFENEVSVYKLFKDIDGYNIFENNYWQKEFKDTYIGQGKQFNCDVVNIKTDKKYDLILNSHVIEHIANPLKAIRNWARILNKNGKILSIVPDKSMMFDCKRPITKFDHLLNDFFNNIGEDDTTHIKEAISLFVNNGGYDYDNYIKSSKNNLKYRAIHHHCFDNDLVKKMFEFLYFKVIYQEQKGMHIITIAQYE